MTASVPHRHKLTADEYGRMGDAGILPPDARVELIDGELIDMAPIGSRHAAAVERLADLLRRGLADRAMVRTQQPSAIDRHSVPQPDVAVVARRDDYYADAHPEPRDVLLVVEVAESTLTFDREVKARMYALGGVPEVWIVDVAAQRILRLTSPRDGEYAESGYFRVGQSISIGAFADASIELREVFPS